MFVPTDFQYFLKLGKNKNAEDNYAAILNIGVGI